MRRKSQPKGSRAIGLYHQSSAPVCHTWTRRAPHCATVRAATDPTVADRVDGCPLAVRYRYTRAQSDFDEVRRNHIHVAAVLRVLQLLGRSSRATASSSWAEW